MKAKLRMNIGAINESVYVGVTNKAGTEWLWKQNLTSDFLACIIAKFGDGQAYEIKENGTPKYELTVREVTQSGVGNERDVEMEVGPGMVD